ncbi:anti-FecI sigma factor, FecR [Niastella koreensis GR20-10]|uniref:Anti-FecI sigma factor, FecR n=2 Tax=Niastella koreensis TaxID=354356 RepID=G8TJ64_NIAKG|nr:FecR domain-containing protein [Niastella koreensis]AEV98597.1 anti-FecI sigma factor, FecR [Niastella koreensis GR20-10]
MPDQYAKYEQYTLSDFMLDEDFLLWIKQPDAAKDMFWNGLALAYPQQQATIGDARTLAAALTVQKETASEATKNRIWNAVSNSRSKMVTIKRAITWMAAAAVVLIIGSVALFKYLGANEAVIKTAYGQKRAITLPDGSQVVLNANSQLKYKPRPRRHAPREVWINGEAWFNVVHLNKTGTPVQAAERFIVHLPTMNVEVLGTTFTINTRRNREQVVLQTGSVKVNVPSKSSPVFLKPGDLVNYNKDSKVLSKATTNPADCALWKENRLKFDNTPLREVIQLIEDDYGYKVAITDSTILERTLGGTLSSESEQILFRALENMLDVKITVNNKTVTISK